MWTPQGIFPRTYLTVLFAMLVLEVAIVAAGLFFVVFPILRTTTDDLANLIVRHGEAWTALNQEGKQWQEHLVRTEHRIHLSAPPAKLPSGHASWLPYIHFLAANLEKQTGHRVRIRYDEDGYFTQLHIGDTPLFVHIPNARIGVQPPKAFALMFFFALLTTTIASYYLAGSLTRSVSTLNRAVQSMGKSGPFHPIPEEGPTEIRDFIATFNTTAQQRQELLDNRSMLFAGIAHDIRTPMTRIRLHSELAMDAVPETDKEAHDHLQAVVAELDKVNTLLSSYLSLHKNHHRPVFREIPIPIFLANLTSTYRQRGITITSLAANPDKEPCLWHSDPLALERVLSNLIENAAKYGRPPILLDYHYTPSMLTITVRDHGNGIPEDDLPSFFQPYKRRISGEYSQGYGLGLAIAKQLIESVGGVLTLENCPDGGLLATLTLPDSATAPSTGDRT